MSRLESDQPVSQILGIELFADSQILRVAVVPARFNAVGTAVCRIDDSDMDFPLADLNRPCTPNATIMLVALRLYPGAAISGAVQFRYHHRDAMFGAPDLKRRYRFDNRQDPDAIVADFLAVVPGRIGEPMVMDLSHLDVAAALDAIAEMPFAVNAARRRGEASTREKYREERCHEKDLARMALAKALMIPYTADVTKESEADLLILNSGTCQAVLAREDEGDITFDPFEAVGDYSVFIERDGWNTFRVLGYLSNRDAPPFWRLGRVSPEELRPAEELIDAGPQRVS